MDRNEFLTNIWQVAEAGGLITSCSWCGRVRLEGAWVKPPRGALSTIDEPLTLSHSICPNCAGAQPSAKCQDEPERLSP